MEIKIGADPELFVRQQNNGDFISAHTFFPGTKDEPFPTVDGGIQVDGVAAEFNIKPATVASDFSLSIFNMVKRMNMMLKNQDDNLLLSAIPTATFSRPYFDALPEKVKELGCSADYNAWTEKENEKPSTTEPFRTGGGHLHIGFTEDADVTDPDFLGTCRAIVKTMDASAYVMSHAWDYDRKRRKLYGSKGSFRPKLYGVEYRPLSNAFLGSIELIEYAFNCAKRSAELVLTDNTFIYKSQEAKKFMEMTDFTPSELNAYNSFLVGFGYEPLSEKIIYNEQC